MRLQKYIASCGVTSRRKAEELIQQGRVKVNGEIIDKMGQVVGENDQVELDGVVIKPDEEKVYYMLNKPTGFITSASDEQGRPTVIDLVSDTDVRVFPVGRLDYNTSGLLLLTNDGQMSYKLMHPQHEIKKTYVAKIQGNISSKDIHHLMRGVDIGGYITAKASAKILKQKNNTSQVEIIIHEGKNRQVRKMFKAIGYQVVELERTAIGELRLGRLKQGHYKKLSKSELDYLMKLK